MSSGDANANGNSKRKDFLVGKGNKGDRVTRASGLFGGSGWVISFFKADDYLIQPFPYRPPQDFAGTCVKNAEYILPSQIWSLST